ncbi:MAG: sugar phosphate isomerase/epimerase, partial [Clostridiales bacterium]|nr:sugar phosphate isomerase/epimerase [Clostridiales bacterium]
EKAKSYDVTISSVHVPFSPFSLLDPAFADPAMRDKVVEIQSELLRAAADSGVEIAVIHPSGEPYAEDEREDRLQCAIDTIGRLNKVAKEAGITLALENLPRTCLCRNSADMLRFLHDIPDLHVCFDTNHNLSEPNVDFIRAVGSHIVTLHVSDYDFVDEKHWFPMEGLNPWNDIFTALEEVGYTGRFTYEVGFKDGKTIADVAENFARLMQ